MWTSVTEANEYLAETVGGEAWASLSADDKLRYLTTAFRKLYNDPDYGFPEDVEEPMAHANIEYAFALLSNSGQQSPADMAAQGVAGFRIGTFSMDFHSSADMGGQRIKYPATVADLIDRYLLVGPAVAEVSARELS